MANLKNQLAIATSSAEQIAHLRRRLQQFAGRYKSLIQKAQSSGFAEEYTDTLLGRARHLNQIIEQLDNVLARDQKKLEEQARVISSLIRDAKG